VTPSLTVSRVARRFGLSRSTLLYYDSIGLLQPSSRSPSGYRLYGQQACRRLERICRYRTAGLGLEEIRQILDGRGGKTGAILEKRLETLNDEIGRLRDQQRVVLQLLRSGGKLRHTRALTKKRWVALLRAAGLDDADMRQWHVEFERMEPEAHRDFLESLGIPKAEVRSIRAWSRERAGKRQA